MRAEPLRLLDPLNSGLGAKLRPPMRTARGKAI